DGPDPPQPIALRRGAGARSLYSLRAAQRAARRARAARRLRLPGREVDAVTNFQTISLTVAALLFAVTLAAAARRAINRRAALGWAVLWIAAAVAIARPSLTVAVARFLGIGRGADLVFYCAILGMLVAF